MINETSQGTLMNWHRALVNQKQANINVATKHERNEKCKNVTDQRAYE